jgi:transcriptional regulator with XRE-family HTH domain
MWWHIGVTSLARSVTICRVGDFGDRLRNLRNALGLSVSETARRAGISRTYVQKLEQASNPRISAAVLSGLSRALETTPEEILPGLNEGPAVLATALLAYLESTDPDPRLVSRLAFLGMKPLRELTPDDRMVIHRAQLIFFDPSSRAVFADVRAQLTELGIDVDEELRFLEPVLHPGSQSPQAPQERLRPRR